LTDKLPYFIDSEDINVYNLFEDIPSGAYMLRVNDFQEVVSIQATVFTPGFNFVTSKILPELFQIHPDEFDGDPTVLPLPQDVPLPVPRIILNDRIGSKKLEVAPERINYYRLKANSEDLISVEGFFSSAASLLTIYLERTGAKCGRIAAILTRFSYKDNPAIEIASHFCKEQFNVRPFNEPSNFEIHAHKKYRFMESFEVNSWVRVKSAFITLKPENRATPSVIVEQDINTLSELIETINYTVSEIALFYDNILNEFNNIIHLYFP
jgi:hypothetical protein